MLDAIAKLNALQRFDCPLSSFVAGDPGINERQLDVVESGGARQQVERLKDEPDLAIAYARQLVLVLVGDKRATEPVFAGGGRVEAADQIHQRRFPRSRRTHDRDVLIAANRDVDPAQGVHDFTANVVVTLQTARDDDPILVRRRA